MAVFNNYSPETLFAMAESFLGGGTNFETRAATLYTPNKILYLHYEKSSSKANRGSWEKSSLEGTYRAVFSIIVSKGFP